MDAPHTLIFLIYPGFQLLDLTGPLAMFAGASGEADRTLYDIRVAAPAAGEVVSSSGLPVTAGLSLDEARAAMGPDTTVLIAGAEEEGIRAALTDPDVEAFVTAALSGAFLLARWGGLDGRRATTHWRSANRLARHFPKVEMAADAIFIRDGHVWTSAGVTAGIDMALAMIETDHDRALALAVARETVVARMRSGGQAQFSADLAAQAVDDRRLARLAEAIRREPERDWSVAAMCDALAVSPRTLSRLCRREMATSPAAFVERVRIDSARVLLVETGQRIDTIARVCGFGPHQRMDRAFMRQLGVSPSEYRARFSSPLPEKA